MNNFVLGADQISRRFSEGKLDVEVLKKIDLHVRPGETIAIVGASGSGKSTLLQILGGLDQPTSGHVSIAGQSLSNLNPTELGVFRNLHLGFVYQFHHLLSEFTALENVAMSLWIRRNSRKHANEQAQQMLEAVGLVDRGHHLPSQLSGGERQRVAIARALITQPACILADEPTGNLDRSTAEQVFQLMMGLAQTHQSAFVVVTHDPLLASRCERRLYLRAGQLSDSE
ncbi:MAG: lipoprotein-releasing ABC transporter ATP-binding protein LolD [Limnohabitans sp.]|nr:lipoprotein-releasing ABC transporter ATP-binding protein LolD [Limnohabitans sp.]